MASQKECLFDKLSRTPVDKARPQVGVEIRFGPGTVLAGSTSCRGWTLRVRVRRRPPPENKLCQPIPWALSKANLPVHQFSVRANKKAFRFKGTRFLGARPILSWMHML